jgi:hypothetical protein
MGLIGPKEMQQISCDVFFRVHPPRGRGTARAGSDHRSLSLAVISRTRIEGRMARAPHRVLVIWIALPDATCRGNVVIEFWREVRIFTGAECAVVYLLGADKT